VRDQQQLRDAVALEQRDALRRVLPRVARLGLAPAQRQAELLCRDAVAISDSGADWPCAQPTPPLKATGTPVSRDSHSPKRRRSSDGAARLPTPYSGAYDSAPPPSTTIARCAGSSWISRMRSGCSAIGTRRTYCSSRRAVPVQVLSHRPARLSRITIQPKPRRGRISRAPISTVTRNGTGGSSRAETIGLPGSDAHQGEQVVQGQGARRRQRGRP
jgi:hypothetical protein